MFLPKAPVVNGLMIYSLLQLVKYLITVHGSWSWEGEELRFIVHVHVKGIK